MDTCDDSIQYIAPFNILYINVKIKIYRNIFCKLLCINVKFDLLYYAKNIGYWFIIFDQNAQYISNKVCIVKLRCIYM